MTVRDVRGDRLSPGELHDLLRLRAAVFIVEQGCPYLDLDGADLLPSTRHLWIPDASGSPLSALRVLRRGGDGWAVGRVVTRADARGRGLAAELIEAALRSTGRPLTLNAQEHLERWYARFGFVRDGDTYDEDGIPHVPMRLGSAR